jgi:uncharacterized membrane protein
LRSVCSILVVVVVRCLLQFVVCCLSLAVCCLLFGLFVARHGLQSLARRSRSGSMSRSRSRFMSRETHDCAGLAKSSQSKK